MTVSNANVVTNGLIFNYDMSNTQKSWIGRPSVNKCNYDTYNYTDGNATVTRGATPPIPPPVTGYEISKIQSNNGGDTSMNILYTSNIDQVNGGVYTHSAWILLTAGTYCRVGQHWNPWDAGSAQYIPPNVWTRVSYTLTNNTNNYGNIANAYGTDGTIYVTAVQYEAGSTATPFIGGTNATRSNTQAIKDLTNNNTLTVNNLTYESDSTFSFNGTNSYISCGNFGSFYALGTVSFWMNSAAIASYPNPFSTHFQGVNAGFRFEGRSDGNFNMVVGNDAGTYTTHTFISSGMQANTWYNITFVWNVAANNVIGYLNGVQVFNESQTYWATTMPSVTIGNGFSSSRFWNGKISNTQIYNRNLTASEVRQNFNALRGRYGI
jgi:hypothetical protein